MHCKPAAQLQPIGLVGNGMAGGTATGIERCDAVGEVRRAGRKRGWGNDRRDRQPPEDAGAGGASQNQAKENSSQHSPIRRQEFQFNDQYGRTFRNRLPRNFESLSAFRE
jgi:hypothetical protein